MKKELEGMKSSQIEGNQR